MNRKGDVSEGLNWIVRLLAAVILYLLLVAQINMVLEVRQQPIEMEVALYRERLLSGPNGIFVHEEGTGRPLPGIVDPARFNDELLTAAYTQEVDRFAARLTLHDDADNIGTENVGAAIAFHEPELVERYLPLAKAGVRGKGGALYHRQVYPVLYRTGSQDEQRWLEVEVLYLT